MHSLQDTTGLKVYPADIGISARLFILVSNLII